MIPGWPSWTVTGMHTEPNAGQLHKSACFQPSCFTLLYKTHTVTQLTSINVSKGMFWFQQRLRFGSFIRVFLYFIVARHSKSVVFFVCLGLNFISVSFLWYTYVQLYELLLWRTTLWPCLHTHTSMLGKRPSVCWCDCLTQSLCWIAFNGNWQQLNSLAPFAGPLLLVPPPPPLWLLAQHQGSRSCKMPGFFLLLRSKSILFLFRGREK